MYYTIIHYIQVREKCAYVVVSPWNYQLVYKYAMYLPSVSWARKYALPQHHWASIHLTGIFYTVLLGQGTFWADFSWTLGPPRGRGYPYISCFLYSMETTINLLHISQHNKKVPSCDLFQEWMPNLSQIYQPRSNTHHEVVSVSIPLDLHHESYQSEECTYPLQAISISNHMWFVHTSPSVSQTTRGQIGSQGGSPSNSVTNMAKQCPEKRPKSIWRTGSR